VNITRLDELPGWAIRAKRFLRLGVNLYACGNIESGRFEANIEPAGARKKRNNRPVGMLGIALLTRHVGMRFPLRESLLYGASFPFILLAQPLFLLSKRRKDYFSSDKETEHLREPVGKNSEIAGRGMKARF
jgi:hypothetical protein